MQLVGAQRRFILMPFIKEAIILGLIGAVIGLTVLFAGWYYFTTEIDLYLLPIRPNSFILSS